jgi:hypothetical protein
MKPWHTLCRMTAGLAAGAFLQGQEVLERLGERLDFSLAGGAVQVALRGSLELEGYAISDPVADLVSGRKETFLKPRFTLYLDTQLAGRGYLFGQLKVDRGFDVFSVDEKTELRLDEFALRYELSAPGSGRLFLQAGKFATVVGNWARRHPAWENSFITAPLPYDALTGIWDVSPVPNADVLLSWAHVRPVGSGAMVLDDKHLRVPVVWGPAYGQGVAMAGRSGRLDYAVELKAVGLSSRPERWDQGFGGVERPTISARVGFRPDPAWDVGLSFSRGEYLDRSPHANIPTGYDRHDYLETVLAWDLSFAWRHFQFWAEIYAARFDVPRVADNKTVSGYMETKYRFTPRFSTALRLAGQVYGHVPGSAGPGLRAGRQTWRLELAPAWRLTSQAQIKLQYGVQQERPSREDMTQSLAVQLAVRF